MILWSLVAIVLLGLAWIRLAPSDPEVWHVDPQVTANQDLASGVRRRIEAGNGRMAALEAEILATPRTRVLAGSAEEGHATYVTRSKWMGFPDYTTIQRADDHIEIWARLRFGASDLGVNKTRVEGWIDALPEAG